MPLCTDRVAQALGEKGYSLVRYPRSDISPLDLIAGEGSPLEWLGPLTQVWTGKEPAPAAVEANVPEFKFHSSGEFKGSLGLRILQGLIRNIGGNVDSNVSISSSLSFSYENPKQYSIAPLVVGTYLKFGDLDSSNPVLHRYLDVDTALDSHFYVITEVLRARKLLVRLSGSKTADVSADVAAVEGLASGKATVQGEKAGTSEVAFEGAVDLTFAFRAYELGYVNQKWTVIGSAGKNKFLSAGPGASTPAHLGDSPVKVT